MSRPGGARCFPASTRHGGRLRLRDVCVRTADLDATLRSASPHRARHRAARGRAARCRSTGPAAKPGTDPSMVVDAAAGLRTRKPERTGGNGAPGRAAGRSRHEEHQDESAQHPCRHPVVTRGQARPNAAKRCSTVRQAQAHAGNRRGCGKRKRAARILPERRFFLLASRRSHPSEAAKSTMRLFR